MVGAFDENNDMLGVVGFRRVARIKLKHKANIWGMYVVPEFRQKGIAKLLLAELLNSAKSLDGLEQINLSVVNSNVNAKGVYDSFGFTIYGVEKNALKIGEEYYDDDLMVNFIDK